MLPFNMTYRALIILQYLITYSTSMRYAIVLWIVHAKSVGWIKVLVAYWAYAGASCSFYDLWRGRLLRCVDDGVAVACLNFFICSFVMVWNEVHLVLMPIRKIQIADRTSCWHKIIPLIRMKASYMTDQSRTIFKSLSTFQTSLFNLSRWHPNINWCVWRCDIFWVFSCIVDSIVDFVLILHVDGWY